MSNGTYTNNSAYDFTTNRNHFWINIYIRNHFSPCNHTIPSEIIVLINKFYMTQLYYPFGDLILYNQIVKGLVDHNIHKPHSIQQHSIVSILNDDNIITTGKPYKYDKITTITIAQLQKLNLHLNTLQILTISSSRENAQHLYNKTKTIGKYLSPTNELCIGETTVSQDIKKLSNNVQIIHGVVGRIYELIKRNALDISQLKLIILDDADILFNKGFKEKIAEIMTYLPATIQIAIFCSVFSDEIKQFKHEYICNAVCIDVKKECNDKLTLKYMKQFYVPVQDEKYKLHELFDILDSLLMTKCIVYCNTKTKAIWLYEQIKQHDFMVSMLHIDMNIERLRDSINEFLNGNICILVSMDLNKMDININFDDLKQVSVIINYDLSSDNESYLLRNGSYKKKGAAINFVCDNQLPISNLERQHSTQMDELPVSIESIFK